MRILNEFKDHGKKWIDLFLKNIPAQILDLVKPLQLQSQQSSQQPENTYRFLGIFSQRREDEPTHGVLVLKK